MNEEEVKHIEPHYNPKFNQYEITYVDENGKYVGVWGDTKEECLEMYNKTIK